MVCFVEDRTAGLQTCYCRTAESLLLRTHPFGGNPLKRGQAVEEFGVIPDAKVPRRRVHESRIVRGLPVLIVAIFPDPAFHVPDPHENLVSRLIGPRAPRPGLP